MPGWFPANIKDEGINREATSALGLRPAATDVVVILRFVGISMARSIGSYLLLESFKHEQTSRTRVKSYQHYFTTLNDRIEVSTPDARRSFRFSFQTKVQSKASNNRFRGVYVVGVS